MAKVTKTTIASKSEQDLNRWCIEMAMRWPIVTVGGYGNAAAQLGGYVANMPRHEADADVLGRANKIMAWVKEAH